MVLRARIRAVLAAALLSLAAGAAFAQPEPVKWSASFEPADARAGESARILVEATMDPGWHIYSLDVKGGPIATSVKIGEGESLKAQGAVVAPKAKRKYDEGFEIEVGIYEKRAVFALPVTVAPGLSGSRTATVEIGFQACDANGCLPPDERTLTVAFEVSPGEVRENRTAALTVVPDQPPQGPDEPKGAPQAGTAGAAPSQAADEFAQQVQSAKKSGLWAFILLSFVGGLLALLTPCVFPMIPITVSFFSKKKEGVRKTNYGGALAYCFGIIATFSALGLIVTAALGPTGIQDLATNPYVNFAVFAVFVALALSLFGLFEIGVPTAVLNKLGSGSRAVGFVGPLLMGLTFSLTSFTCTVPIVGVLLVGAAAGGDFMFPLFGMIAFSAAFSLPFFFLALFPDFLTRLPRSGAWMSQVKVFMGFVELIAAVKFLSNMDLVWGLGWLTQPVFLAVWSTLAAIAGLQLLGLLKLGNQTGDEPIGWLRRGFGFASVGAATYFLAAMQGAPLGELAAFLPPDPYPGKASAASGPVAWRHDYASALAEAKAAGKPLFINFTGVT